MTHTALIGLFLIAAVAFAALPIIAARFLRPQRPNATKQSTYECGLEVIGELRMQFKPQYYLYALIFVIFDIEVVFLYPWAVAYGQLGLFALVEMGIFLIILAAALVYAWRKGALAWE
jgi:NADH-quinone oxidoreductase subunit A